MTFLYHYLTKNQGKMLQESINFNSYPAVHCKCAEKKLFCACFHWPGTPYYTIHISLTKYYVTGRFVISIKGLGKGLR